MEQLLKRLKSGEAWLRETNERLLAMDGIGRGTELEQTFLDSIILWDDLDMALRNIYPEFVGCALGEGRGCAGDAPVRCRSCGT